MARIDDFRMEMARLIAHNPKKVYSMEELMDALPNSKDLTPERVSNFLNAHVNVEQKSPFAPDLRPTLMFMREKTDKKYVSGLPPTKMFITGIKDPEFAMDALEKHKDFTQHEWKQTRTRVHFYDEHGVNKYQSHEHKFA